MANSKITARAQEAVGHPRNPCNAQNIRRRFDRIRILIIGRANAGKTTVLQKVCGTTDQPVVYNARGEKVLDPFARGLHDINNATVFESNPGFIFHDSQGFEAGGAQELIDVKAFISARSGSIALKDQIHVIWYCIPVDDDRPFTRAEISFFTECGTGNVPVIVIFTKFDAMDDKAFSELTKLDKSTDEARVQAPGHAVMMFERDLRGILYGMKYPPKNHVLLRDMNLPNATCQELVNCTASVIDNEALKLSFISFQQSNLALCMEIAVNDFGRMDVVKMPEAMMNCFPHSVIGSRLPDGNGRLMHPNPRLTPALWY
ncbi:GTP-binding protein [Athelia psychrophila]|uniref:GTP-binding protein n=1 Tax=Athelia psychrophila TaxID=1759441 RepID=A0A167T3S3_9AGAM|nr:GTP-binding protein [Fibularhizoctonia sp. CBS 109695]